jgi:uncharacterized protein (DUF427 family)
MKATWNGATIAESDDTVVVEGNHYFPAGTLRREYLQPSEKTSFCPWKGTASYWSVEVGGERADDSVWFYREPYRKAEMVRDRVAFWKGVEVHE